MSGLVGDPEDGFSRIGFTRSIMPLIVPIMIVLLITVVVLVTMVTPTVSRVIVT